MKIYLAHSSNFDFKNELYVPIKNSSELNVHEFVFPHTTNVVKSSKQIIQECKMVVAEVSYPSTGLGIEIGWADAMNIPIICIYKNSSKPSSSLQAITNTMISYADNNDLTKKLVEALNSYV